MSAAKKFHPGLELLRSPSLCETSNLQPRALGQNLRRKSCASDAWHPAWTRLRSGVRQASIVTFSTTKPSITGFEPKS